MLIQVLGTGCPKCKKLAEVAEAAAKENGTSYQLEKVTDLQRIMGFGVMSMPDLVERIAGLAQDAPASARQP